MCKVHRQSLLCPLLMTSRNRNLLFSIAAHPAAAAFHSICTTVLYKHKHRL
jgi:hypothetical protein